MIRLLMVIIALVCEATGLAAQTPDLSAQQRSMVAIAAFVANGREDNLKQALDQGLNAGLTINKIGEIILQSYAYAGFPRCLNALATFRKLLQERQAKGIKDEFGQEPDHLPTNISRYMLGLKNINTLTGNQANQARPDTLGYEATIDVFLKEHLFADIIGRDNLPFSQRELVTVSILSTLGGVSPQLTAHMNGAMNLGISEVQLKELVSIIQNQVGVAEGQVADQVLDQVLADRKKMSAQETTRTSTPSLTNYVPEVFSKGKRQKNEHFFGAFWVADLVPLNSTVSAPVVNVTFEPGSHTNWHSHPGGQILLVTMGTGYYQEWGQAVRELKQGDVVVIGPNVKHWHGAAKDSWFAHLSINPDPKAGSAVWLEKVDESAYDTLKVTESYKEKS